MKYFKFWAIILSIAGISLTGLYLLLSGTIPRLDYRVVVVASENAKFNKTDLEKYLANNISIYANLDKTSLDKEIIKYDPKLIIEKFEIKPFNKLIVLVSERNVGHLVKARNGIFAIGNDGYVTNRVSYLNEKTSLENQTNIEYYKNLSEGEYSLDPLLITSLNYSNLKSTVMIQENGINTILDLDSKQVIVRLPETKNSRINSNNILEIMDYIKNNRAELQIDNIKEVDLRHSRIVLRS